MQNTGTFKIVVIGGSGLIGRQLVPHLRQRGHKVLVASPSNGVNTVTGEGLAEAMAGARVVVDVSNSSSFEDKAVLDFFVSSGRNLAAAAAAAGVQHHVALSVVGTDRLPGSGYFRAKLAQEQLIHQSGIPFSIVRATQFFEFVSAIAGAATQGDTVTLSSALMQPIASADVASIVAETAMGAPLNGIIEIAGPEPIRMHDLVQGFLDASQDARHIVVADAAGYFGTPVDDSSLTPVGQARLGGMTFSGWLAQTLPA